MRWLCLLLGPQLRVRLLKGELGPSIVVDGLRLSERPTTEPLIFYDWIVDSAGAVGALEIHLEPEHPLFRTSISFGQLPYIDTEGFLLIWLSGQREYKALNLEAFGDLELFESKDGRLAIVVGIDGPLSAGQRTSGWLSDSQRDRLLCDLGLPTSQ